MPFRILALILALPLAMAAAAESEPLPVIPAPEVVSAPGLTFGSFEEHGYKIVPVDDITPLEGMEDLAPARFFELECPGIGPVRLGRILTSCPCLSISAVKRDYMAGERILLELHNVRPTPKDGAIYAFFVQIVSPVDLTLRHDVFVKSELEQR